MLNKRTCIIIYLVYICYMFDIFIAYMISFRTAGLNLNCCKKTTFYVVKMVLATMSPWMLYIQFLKNTTGKTKKSQKNWIPNNQVYKVSLKKIRWLWIRKWMKYCNNLQTYHFWIRTSSFIKNVRNFYHTYTCICGMYICQSAA